MSFSGTPLGQGRRLDHRTFLNKSKQNQSQPNITFQTRPTEPDRSIPSSYAYGAPTLATRSPPKQLSSTSRDAPADTSHDDPALVRFARLKERQHAGKASDLGPRIITSPPNPTKWTVKDTSVQIATAFQQAANSSTEMPSMNPNDSWASGSRSITNVPRSTSVEYEKETQSTTTRRLGAPPSRLAPPARSSGASRQPLGKTQSLHYVPDSEDEREEPPANGRGKSPFDSVIDMAKRTAFYLRQRSQEPEGAGPSDQNGQDPSYDYEAEEREHQANMAARRNKDAGHKRNRMSMDNKAYRPSQSDLEESDEEISDEDRRRRRKAKKNLSGLTLPVTSYDSKKRRKRKPAAAGQPAGEEEEWSEEHVEQPTRQPSQPPASRASVPRTSVPPQVVDEYAFDHPPGGESSMEEAEQGLSSISELDEAPPMMEQHSFTRSRSAFSVGGVLGRVVNMGYRLVTGIFGFFFRVLLFILGMIGRTIGVTLDTVFNQPLRWLRQTNPGPVVALLKYVTAAAVVYVAWLALQDRNLSSFIPSVPSRSNAPFTAPEIPAADMAQLSARLQALENALAGLSLDNQRARAHQDSDARSRSEISGRLGALESTVQKERARALEAESLYQKSASQGIRAVREEVEALQTIVKAAQREEGGKTASDTEARAKLEALEERIGSVEGGVRDALELGKTAAKAGGAGAATGAAWWNKLMSGNSHAVTIKSSDGQDVTALIGHLVDTAVARHAKDDIAKADFALHSGGAQVVPSLTSPTLEIRPDSLRMQLLGFITGQGTAVGRPPIWALHHENHNGHCWPFRGSEGQLGVLLAAPVYIDEVTIDHVAKEVAWDMRSAPRDMELWGLVEGKENFAKVEAWKEDRRRKREEAEAAGEELEDAENDETYPRTLPHSPQYFRIAKFAYDVHAPNNVQTFPVPQDIRDLHLDFGVVALRIKSNWGRKEYTCLYRLRVHGEKKEEAGLPQAEDPSASAPDAESQPV
ncbi:hypothetical protein DENSPDRAFT_813460 [Dentipellis sp. KUC8613]|nr:hypothetical protein DENSPDRAFT_813460 [Dentipellis sp. KUC8613]